MCRDQPGTGAEGEAPGAAVEHAGAHVQNRAAIDGEPNVIRDSAAGFCKRLYSGAGKIDLPVTSVFRHSTPGHGEVAAKVYAELYVVIL